MGSPALTAQRRLDRHYTPPHIADALVSTLTFRRAATPSIVDFAAGSGVLLEAAEKRFSGSTCTATDVDDEAVRLLRVTHPDWRVGRCDFLNLRSIAGSPYTRPAGPLFDAAVLNPPFSCRGQHVVRSVLFGHELQTSVALAFVVRALAHLEPDGQVAVLLPKGSLFSDKDAPAWRVLRAHAEVTVAQEVPRGEFAGAFATCALIHMQRRRTAGSVALKDALPDDDMPTLTVFRGHLPLHEMALKPREERAIHTTHLRDGRILRSTLKGPKDQAVRGPLLLVPRVGRPMAEKIVLFQSKQRLVLSDCLFAVRGEPEDLRRLRATLLERWSTLRAAYGGSCAPYITTRRLLDVLRSLGHPAQVEARLRGRRSIEGHEPV